MADRAAPLFHVLPEVVPVIRPTGTRYPLRQRVKPTLGAMVQSPERFLTPAGWARAVTRPGLPQTRMCAH